MDSEEEWRTVEEAPGYKISSRGRLARRHLNWQGEEELRILRPATNRGGYFRYVLSMGSVQNKVNRWAHTLVCTAWHGPMPPEKDCVAHGDGNPKNNTPENLRWATHKENAEDRVRHGRTMRGRKRHPDVVARMTGDNHYARRHPELVRRGKSHWRTGTRGQGAIGSLSGQSKLTEDQVRAIMAAPYVHGSGRKLADKYGVSMAMITHIRKGRAWTHLRRQA